MSPVRKHARSSLDIHNKKESVTDKDLDEMLKELSLLREFEIEDSSQPRVSTPPPTEEDVVPLSEIVGTLQRGFILPDEDFMGTVTNVCSYLVDHN